MLASDLASLTIYAEFFIVSVFFLFAFVMCGILLLFPFFFVFLMNLIFNCMKN